MRIVLWGERFWPYIGGAEVFAANLIVALRTRGYEFAVLTGHDTLDLPDEASYRNAPVYRFHFAAALASRQIDQLAGLRQRVASVCRELAPCLIHLNGLGPSAFFCLPAAQAAVAPVLVRLNHEIAPSQISARTLAGNVLRRAAWVTGVSAAVLAQARQMAPDIGARSSVIYTGVEVPSAPPEAPPGPPRLLYVGRLARDKGCDLAIAGFPAILRRWPQVRLLIAGDGPEAAALHAQATALGVAAAVDFLGWIAPEDVPGLIARAALVVLPSRTEGLPAVALQAAAMGRPAVATRVGGLPEIVQNGETGLLVDGESTAIAAAVTSLLERPEAVRRMGAAAWRRARDVFNQTQCVDAFDALYRRLAEQSS